MRIDLKQPASAAEVAALARRLHETNTKGSYKLEGFARFDTWILRKESLNLRYAHKLCRIAKHFQNSPHFESLFEHPLSQLIDAIRDPSRRAKVYLHGTAALPPYHESYRPYISCIKRHTGSSSELSRFELLTGRLQLIRNRLRHKHGSLSNAARNLDINYKRLSETLSIREFNHRVIAAIQNDLGLTDSEVLEHWPMLAREPGKVLQW